MEETSNSPNKPDGRSLFDKNSNECYKTEEVAEKNKDVHILSIDKVNVEEKLPEDGDTREVLLSTSKSTKKLLESTERVCTKSHSEKCPERSEIVSVWCHDHQNARRKINRSSDSPVSGGKFGIKELSKLPVGRVQKVNSIGALSVRRISPIKLTKSSSIGALIASEEFGKKLNLLEVCKVPPIVPPKPTKQIEPIDEHRSERDDHVGIERTTSKNNENLDNNSTKLKASVEEIERLQKNLTKIDPTTAETYKQKLPGFSSPVLVVSSISDLGFKRNISKASFNTEFLAIQTLNEKLKIEEEGELRNDVDYASELDTTIKNNYTKPKYSKAVLEIEKRWSGEFLDPELDQNSSESSKSSYVEELESVSSHDSVVEDIHLKSHIHIPPLSQESEKLEDLANNRREGIFYDTISTIDSDSFLVEHIQRFDTDDDDDNNGNGSKDSTLKGSSSTNTCQDSGELSSKESLGKSNLFIDQNRADTVLEELRTTVQLPDDPPENHKDAYADLIKKITMEAGSSKNKDEKKKKGGLRRLLPGIFSPKDSRKDYKKDQKERRKRDDRHFSQHQQNGIFTRSPDTMNLNEDIERNINLDTSLNGSIIEERLNEIKQELFPDQGMITSTPDHFLQIERSHNHGRRTPKVYTANSSISSIAVEDKWIDQNIISGSPDMRKLKQNITLNDNERKCGLERKHSFQESQPRFFRNHGPSGRISAPPSERFLIRPRAVHPMDRPLPAIPQKVEFSNYNNHDATNKNSGFRREVINHQQNVSYFPGNQNYANEGELYENGNHIENAEINRNQSIDSGFISTPVSNQVKISRPTLVNQNSQKLPVSLARSPKYSPSSSQKSGDYADSSYTPNSSQKSEFSPGSSKSGEYYLHSPRNSCRTSPDSSFNDRKDLEATSYQVPSNIRVQTTSDHLYDEAPRSSPCELNKSSTSPRREHQGVSPEVPYTQKALPNIPLSSNLAKLKANMETTRSESPRNFESQPPRISSPVLVTRSSELVVQTEGQMGLANSPLPSSSRVTSPLTILPPENPCMKSTLSPNGANKSQSTIPQSFGAMSPNRISIQMNQGQLQTPNASPTMWNTRTSGVMSSFQPRKAQPSDQILIASPKREGIYETQVQRSSSRIEPRSSESPVPMTDSPSQVLSPRGSHRNSYNVDKLARNKSPTVIDICDQPPPQAFQDDPKPVESPKEIQRPEPIYVRRHGNQRAISPLAINSNEVKVPQIYEGSNMLLVETVLENDKRSTSHLINHEKSMQTPLKNNHEVSVQQQRVVSPRTVTPETHKDSNMSPERPGVLQLRRKDPNLPHERPQGIYGDQRVLAQSRSTSNEQIYGIRPRQLPVAHQGPQRIEVQVQQHKAPVPVQQIQQVIYSTKQDMVNRSPEQIYGWKVNKELIHPPQNEKQDPLYGRRTPESTYGQHSNKQISPSKRQTLQHLEAFYWQQKALESSRSSTNSPTTSNRSNETNTSCGPPEVREAIYWQQLKKLDEEQQRKIYERNQFEDRNEYMKKKMQSPSSSPMNHSGNSEQIYWKNKISPKGNIAAKPPIVGQKGQNQPVLVVRPQQAVRDPNHCQATDQSSVERIPRSKSVSPHFIRGDERRSLQLPRRRPTETDDGGFNESKISTMIARKSTTPPIYGDNDDRKNNPPPIFKRGSLISNSSSSVDYGTMGTKRVSFSNQSTSPEIGSGHWPTKHGMAPEPPTRKHRTGEKTSDSTDQVFSRAQEENQNNTNNIYSNTSCSGQKAIYETEYDAKPLPPPPKNSWTIKRSNSMRDSRTQEVQRPKAAPVVNPRRWPGVSESESGSEAGEVPRILQRRLEEEWNPGGKGRQSNDTGGSGRVEGEGGSNDIPTGRRGGGILGGGRSAGSGGGGGRSRDEPRRHTLSGDHAPSLHHQQFNSQQLHPLHPHHLPPPHGQYGTLPNRHTTMDLEMGTKSRQRKSPLPRGYPPPSTAMLFDDDPGIMSEVETSCTGFRRGGKQRSSLPVVRTPSKTLERPLGLVFLQYRKETKRALLPNEITSIDTVKALFVRSFSKQLTMEYLDLPDVKIYIHDSNKDMFYELEDHRSHLRDIRDRSVLRLIEKTDGLIGMPGGPVGVPVGGQGLPPHWEDQSYFSEPEFDSEFQHQHIHKSKTSKNSTTGSYYMGGSSTLPRGGSIMRAYSPASAILAGPNATPTQPKTLGTPGGGGVAPAKPLRGYQCGKTPLGSLGGSARFSRDSSVSLYSIPDRIHGESGYMSSPERSGGVGSSIGRYPTGPYSTGSSYEEPYYSAYSGTVTPVIDEEASDTELLEESYSLYGVKPPGRPPPGPPRSPFPPGAPALPPGQTYDVTRIRVEHMERQLANLTGLVQKALTHAPHTSPSPRDYLQVPAGRDPYSRSAGAGDEFDKHSSSSSASLPDDSYLRTDVKTPKLGKDKSVSFEKSVSFSDEPPDMNSPKQHSPQHAADTKPTKPAIKSSTLPRMSSQERDRHKPTPPPKPVALATGPYVYRDLALTPEMYNQLRGLQKKAKDLRQEVRNLRRMSQAQAHTVRETIRDTFITIRSMLLSGGEAAWAAGDTEKIKLSRDEDLYKQEMIRLEKDLTELESTVEELRGNVINRKTRVNMSDVENMALILSKSSKTVADLKVRFPSLQEGMKGLLSSEMEKVVREEKFLKEEPERLESALRRCKKLTGTLVTLKRLASVQEQRLPNAVGMEAEETPPITPTTAQHSKTTAPVPAERNIMGSTGIIGGGSHSGDSSTSHQQRPENALDALLDELQTFSRPSSQLSQVSGMSQPTNHMPTMLELGRSASQILPSGRAPNISEIGRKGSIDSSGSLALIPPGNATLRRLHSYPSSSDTDTSPPIARIQGSDGTTAPQKPPVPERNAELLQLATARRVPPPPPPRTSSRSPLASPTSPQLPPRNPTGTLRRGRPKESGKPPMALPPGAGGIEESQNQSPSKISPGNILSTSNSSSCESINSQEGLQNNKKGRQEQLEQRHQELLRKQKALQEQYARLQQLQRNASGVATVPPTPPDLLKKTGSESNILAKMGLNMTAANSGSLTSLTIVKNNDTGICNEIIVTPATPSAIQTTTNKVYETDIL